MVISGFRQEDEKNQPKELGRLYQAILVHTHPPKWPPSICDAWHAVAASCPRLVVVDGETAHLVTVWHTTASGFVAAVLEMGAPLDQSRDGSSPDLVQALNFLRREARTSWNLRCRYEKEKSGNLDLALTSVARQWREFVREACLAVYYVEPEELLELMETDYKPPPRKSWYEL